MQSLSNYLKRVLSQHPARDNLEYSHKVYFSNFFFRENMGNFTELHNDKINLEVTCKLNSFGYWNLCRHLPNFVNMAALLTFICLK